MKSVGIPPARKKTPGEFINDHHPAVVRDDVLVVLGVQRIRPEELGHRVDPVATLRVEQVHIVLLPLLFIGAQGPVCFDDADLGAEIGKHKEILVCHLRREVLAPSLGEIDLVVLLVDGIVEIIVDFVHPPPLVAQVLVLRHLHQPLV